MQALLEIAGDARAAQRADAAHRRGRRQGRRRARAGARAGRACSASWPRRRSTQRPRPARRGPEQRVARRRPPVAGRDARAVDRALPGAGRRDGRHQRGRRPHERRAPSPPSSPRSVVTERGATARLAQAFQALVPEPDRRESLVALAESRGRAHAAGPRHELPGPVASRLGDAAVVPRREVRLDRLRARAVHGAYAGGRRRAA